MTGRPRTATEVLHDAGAVIFDCDDTVIATAKSRWDLLITTAASFGVSLSREAIRLAWGLPFDSLIHTLVPTVQFDEFVRRYRLAMRSKRAEPTRGAVELLRKLSDCAVPMEIVTSSRRELILQDLDQLGLSRHFENIYGQAETPFHKPDPRVLYVVVEALSDRGFKSEDLVYIGDSIRDYKVAVGNSIEFIAVLSGLETRSDFVAAGLADERIVDGLFELL